MDGTPARIDRLGKTRFAKGSLGRQVMIWFVLMAVTPLAVVAFISYHQAKDALSRSAFGKLNDAANEAHRFIQNWFDYRRMDIASQAGAYRNAWLMEYVQQGIEASGKSVAQYVRSGDWQNRLEITQGHLLTLIKRYDYIEDVFLIDRDGFMLFNTRHDSVHLGSNLFTGPYQNSRFAHAVKRALFSSEFTYSDIDRYGPSRHELTSFITAPLADENGDIKGVFAMEIRLDRILKLMSNERQAGISHYLIGADGRLRTPVFGMSADVLNRHVNVPFNDPALLAIAEIVYQQGGKSTYRYKGIHGKPVFGVAQPFEYLGVHWTLVTEVAVGASFALVNTLAYTVIGLVFLITLIALALAFVLTKRLSAPINQLAHHAIQVSEGKNEKFSAHGEFNEIKLLGGAFNQMLKQRNQNENALHASNRNLQGALERMVIQEQRYRSLVANIPGVVYRCKLDQDWTMMFMSDFIEELAGYSATGFIANEQQTYASLIHPDDQQKVEDTVLSAVNSTGEYEIEYRIMHAAGKVVWVYERGVVIKGNSGQVDHLDGFIMDITQTKEYETELIEAKQKAEASAQAKSDFLAVVSHEIRTPLNGVIGMLGILEKTQLDTNQYNKTQVAKDSANALLALINDILDFSKVDAGKLDLEDIDFDVVELFDHTLESIKLKASEKNVDVFLDMKRVDHQWLRGDPTRVRQILSNLVSNSLKFTDEGWIKVQVMLDHYKEHVKLICMVSDTGIGIPYEKMSELFDSFTQVDSSITRKYGGTGLGLAICKRLCQLMHGDIWVTSEVGQGSQFTFQVALHLAPVPKDDTSDTEQSSDLLLLEDTSAEQTPTNQNLRVLLVDDNSINLMVAEDLLGDLGLHAETACTGIEALDTLADAPEDAPFELVFMDCQMPEMDGYTATQEIRNGAAGARYRGIPIVAMTAHAMEGDREKCLAAGMDDYVPKPIHVEQLKAAVDRWAPNLGDRP